MPFTFHAFGHPAVLSTHPTTLEITKQSHLSTQGDCVIGVNSSIGISELPKDLKSVLTNPKGKGRVKLTIGELSFIIEGRGGQGLTFAHPTDLVIRKSGFISNRTLMIHADRSAKDLPRQMVRQLQDPSCMITVEISAIVTE